MYASAFNLYVEDYPVPGQTLIHNTFSGAYVVLDEHERAALRKTELEVPLTDVERTLLEQPEWSLSDVGIVVANRDDEAREYRALFDAQRGQGALHGIITINLACNFACPYCYQANVMSGEVMSRSVLEHTADWLAERVCSLEAGHARLTFVGGEPLLHPDRIKTISERVKQRLQGRGIELRIGLITNGYFLDEDMVSELLPYGLDVAQVTVDGDETTHARSRVCKTGEDTFQRIFDNIVTASRRIRIVVNGNYQADTISGFAPLVKKLAAAGLPQTTSFQFTPALEMLHAPADSVGGVCTWSEANHGYRVALHDQILGSGFQTKGLNNVGPCGFHKRDLFVIDPAGNIFKCPGFVGHPEWRIGDVQAGLSGHYEQQLGWDTMSSCGDCRHRPNCAGGCVADEAVRTGVPAARCEAPYLDAMETHAVVRGYQLASHDERAQAIAHFPAPPVALPTASPPANAAVPISTSGKRSQALTVLRP